LALDVTATLLAFRQLNTDQKEAGGILLGRLIEATDDVIVDEVTSPNKADRRGRFFFFRKRNTTQQRINTAWKESAHTRVYLGEWHTHPEDDPSPSGVDIENWSRIGRTARYEQEFLFFIIVGITTIRVWERRKDGAIAGLK
jgi:integrative and conjugative element protein (TIGR02256 family)